MKVPRRGFLHLAVGAAALPGLSRIAMAQTYPSRPITMIVPFPAGGTTDVVGRLLAERTRGPLGQPIIIENVTGADGSIGTGRAARARPDGYTIVLGFGGTHVMNGALYSLEYDVLNDFAPICPLVRFPIILFARKSMPAKDLTELIAWLKANPNKASAAIASSSLHQLTAFFQKETGTKFTLVPYRGVAPAVQDLVAFDRHAPAATSKTGAICRRTRQLDPMGSLAGSLSTVRRNASRPARYCLRSAASRYFGGSVLRPPRRNHCVCTLPSSSSDISHVSLPTGNRIIPSPNAPNTAEARPVLGRCGDRASRPHP
jgi:Tripartite tricarboxylate transporter family receptor